MKEFFVRLWTDASFFERCLRTVVFLFGTAMERGALPVLDGSKSWWASMLVQALALFVPAGQKNNDPQKLAAPGRPKTR